MDTLDQERNRTADKPLVSVVIPVYNRAHCVEKAMQSVLDQTYSNLELIMVDDGSKDASAQVIKSVGDPRVKYIYQENAGACAARNRGVAYARGEYIAFHDSDDTWHETKLEKQMNAMTEHGADVVICKQVHIQGERVVQLTPKRIGQRFVSLQDDIFGIGTQTILTRKSVLLDEPFDGDMPRLQDFEWLYRVLHQYKVFCIDEGLVDYIVGDDSITRSHEKRYIAMKLFIEKHPEVKKELPFLSMHFVKDLIESTLEVRKTDRKDSRKYLRLARAYFPGIFRFARAAVQQKRRNAGSKGGS